MALTHFVKDPDVVFSIIENGFVYFHNETKTLLPIIRTALGLSAESIEPPTSGMICFTDIPIEQSEDIRKDFGNYGISILRGWAKFRNAKRVIYLSGEGTAHERLLRKFNEVRIMPTGDHLEHARMQFASVKFMEIFFPYHPHTQFLKDLEWTQTDFHQAQKEWRIRNPNASAEFFASIAKMGKKEGIEYMLKVKKSSEQNDNAPLFQVAINEALTLKLDNDAVINFVCPTDDIEIFSSKLAETRFRSTPILPVTRV